MNRIDQTLSALKKAGKKALIPYVTAGFPTKASTVEVMHAMVEAGANIIELGVPFSDPMADGPTIQKSNEQSLALGVGMRDILEFVSQFRASDSLTPVVLMGYANPIEAMGIDKFFAAAKHAGVDGVLVVDYPPEEAQSFAASAEQNGIAPIFLLAPTSTDERIAQVAKLARGYVYYVSLKGITGAGHIDTREVGLKVAHMRTFMSIPIGVGFGIRDAATAKAIGAVSDAVVIGTRMIQLLEDGVVSEAPDRAKAFLSGVRQALDELA